MRTCHLSEHTELLLKLKTSGELNDTDNICKPQSSIKSDFNLGRIKYSGIWHCSDVRNKMFNSCIIDIKFCIQRS